MFLRKIVFLFVVFVSVSIRVGADNKSMYSIYFDKLKNATVVLNGFVYKQNSDEELMENFELHLKNGINKIKIKNVEEGFFMKLTKIKEDGLVEKIYSLNLDSKNKQDLNFDFNLSDYPSQWSWTSAQSISYYDRSKHKTIYRATNKNILEAVNRYINAYKTGNFEKLFTTLLKYKLSDMIIEKNLSDTDEAKKLFIGIYNLILSPDMRKKFILPKSNLQIDENDNILTVTRKNGEPIIEILTESDQKFKLMEIYLFIKNGELYIL
jgi:hypothetical protein